MKALPFIGSILILLAHSIAANRGEPPKVNLHEIVTDYTCNPKQIQIKDTCHKNKSDNNPFCFPSSNDLWYADGSYYVTWDAEFCDDDCTLALQYGHPDVLDDKVYNEVVDRWDMEKGKRAQIVTVKEHYLFDPVLLKATNKTEKLPRNSLFFVLLSKGLQYASPGPMFQITDLLLSSQPYCINERTIVIGIGCFIGLIIVMIGIACAIPSMKSSKNDKDMNKAADSSESESDTHVTTVQATKAKEKGPGRDWRFWRRWGKGYSGRKVRGQRT
ncbi:hypothetical protein FPQ18DRAFT_408899 [Pyronema domesticum]|nr:hypothetical protein FPQ18DRAFT_408899 [Pyronema domesticum]